jgi:hypothetical protein
MGKKARTITRLYGFDLLHYLFKRVMADDFWNSGSFAVPRVKGSNLAGYFKNFVC